MAAKYILAVLALVFLLAGASRWPRPAARTQARTWLLVGAIFAAVAAWLFWRG